MNVPHLYVESTMFNFYFYGKGKEKQAHTLRLFDAIAAGTYEAFTSEYALKELRRDTGARYQKMFALVDKYRLHTFPMSDEVDELAVRYVDRGIIPEKYIDDANHIAVCALNGLDFVVSYNYNHIVKLKTIIGTALVNRRLGLPIVGLCTPKEILDYEDCKGRHD
ncbi:MAG: putative PIN domain protein [Treponematales bacterium]